jgi:hypothetical protein
MLKKGKYELAAADFDSVGSCANDMVNKFLLIIRGLLRHIYNYWRSRLHFFCCNFLCNLVGCIFFGVNFYATGVVAFFFVVIFYATWFTEKYRLWRQVAFRTKEEFFYDKSIKGPFRCL